MDVRRIDLLVDMVLLRRSVLVPFVITMTENCPEALTHKSCNILVVNALADDIPLDVKTRRLNEIIRMQNHISLAHNKLDVGQIFKVLIEGNSKKSDAEFKGRNSQNKMLVFPKVEGFKAGDYCLVKVNDVTSATLKGEIIRN